MNEREITRCSKIDLFFGMPAMGVLPFDAYDTHSIFHTYRTDILKKKSYSCAWNNIILSHVYEQKRSRKLDGDSLMVNCHYSVTLSSYPHLFINFIRSKSIYNEINKDKWFLLLSTYITNVASLVPVTNNNQKLILYYIKHSSIHIFSLVYR